MDSSSEFLGLFGFLIIVFIGFLYEVFYIVYWKGRNDRKLIERLRDQAYYNKDDPNTILAKLVYAYCSGSLRLVDGKIVKNEEKCTK